MKKYFLLSLAFTIHGFSVKAQTIIASAQDTQYEGGEIKFMESNSNYNPWNIDNYAGNLRFYHGGQVYFHLNADGKLGIGTTVPDSKLTVKDGINNQLSLINSTSNSWQFRAGSTGSLIFRDDNVERIRIDALGNLGVGTASPQGKLHISTETSGDAILRLEADTDNNNESDNPLIQLRQDSGLVGINMGFSQGDFGDNVFGIGTRRANLDRWDTFTIDTSNDNIGIGTTAPDAKLTVNGDIHAEEVLVDLSVPGPDYVFKADYNLRTLEETQNYIQKHGHLPNIPSAKEMEEDGVELGTMNMKLLEKIEELTLYTIDQDKQINELSKLKEENKLLKQKILKIENLLVKLLETNK